MHLAAAFVRVRNRTTMACALLQAAAAKAAHYLRVELALISKPLAA
jgi:hypothetical protein